MRNMKLDLIGDERASECVLENRKLYYMANTDQIVYIFLDDKISDDCKQRLKAEIAFYLVISPDDGDLEDLG